MLMTLLAVATTMQSAPAATVSSPPKSILRAVRAQPPEVDGALTDPVWMLAEPASRFTQRDPVEGAPATLATEARVLYSEFAIYVGIRAYDSDAASIMTPLAARDRRPHGDWLGIMIDSHYDRRTAFEFAVNPAGVKQDAYRYNDFERDIAWDAVWDAKVQRDSLGWTAEFEIPLSQLRFIPSRDLRFGFNIYREVGRSREVQYWSALSKQDRSVVARFGDLIGLEELPAPSHWQVSPYATARSGTGGKRLRAGLDARMTLAGGLTVTATVNPDFGQVEADPAVVNLTALEAFYPERRPLFVEDVDLFRLPLDPDSFSTESLLYTRRIGRAPQHDNVTDPVPILGAVKTVWRSATGWSFASLAAVTGRSHTMVMDTAGESRRIVAEPGTTNGAFRLSRDLHEGRTQIATFGTLSLRASSTPAPGLRSRAGAGGVSLSYRPSDGPYLGRVLVAFSHVSGTAAAIAATQLSPVHYFQRPDQSYTRFDSTITSLTGTAAWLEVARDRGTTTGRIALSALSPGLEVNDLGFLSQAGVQTIRGSATHRWLEKTRFREAALHLETFWDADWGGRASGRGAGMRASILSNRYWMVSAEVWRALGGAETTVLRGGPALMRAGNNFFRFDVKSNPQRAFRTGITLVHRPFDEALASEQRAHIMLAWRAAPNLELELTPSYEWNHNRHQYVGTAAPTNRPLYILGWLKQESLRAGLRANWTFTPSLSVEGYAEALSTSGRHREFYEVVDAAARARADRLRTVASNSVHSDGLQLTLDADHDGTPELTIPQPDFTLLSLRSTILLRWQFRPGSDLSFVVQQHGSESRVDEVQSALRRLERLRALPHRVLAMFKISYWLPI